MKGLLLALLLVATPALADEWGHYDNARYGYGIDIPPGFVGAGEADNGDGQVFTTPTARLTVYGANVMAADFEAEVADRESLAEADGWTLTYRVSTPDKASYSGSKGSRILYARLIALCDGAQFAAFELDYSRADLGPFDPVVNRLVRSFRGTGTC